MTRLARVPLLTLSGLISHGNKHDVSVASDVAHRRYRDSGFSGSRQDFKKVLELSLKGTDIRIYNSEISLSFSGKILSWHYIIIY